MRTRDHPPTVTGSAGAYPCARDIIAYYVEYGKNKRAALSVSFADSSPTGRAKTHLLRYLRPPVIARRGNAPT